MTEEQYHRRIVESLKEYLNVTNENLNILSRNKKIDLLKLKEFINDFGCKLRDFYFQVDLEIKRKNLEEKK